LVLALFMLKILTLTLNSDIEFDKIIGIKNWYIIFCTLIVRYEMKGITSKRSNEKFLNVKYIK
jgi:hypothetical protein